MAKITDISKFAARQGFKVGDDLVALGGYPFKDILDYLYFDNERKFEAVVVREGKEKKLSVSKSEGQSLGLEFDLEMKPIHCKNKCIFCFVDQLPKGMRDTLYVKDDDYRLSFVSGCYVTLTNLSDEDIQRIIRLKLSPIYISVHAFSDDIRFKMVKNPNTLNLIPLMKKLGQAGIIMHTQLVIVPGVNDGDELTKSIEGLRGIMGVETVAVVPVGLTKHRDNLPELRTPHIEEAASTVKEVERLHSRYNGFCWCSDEYYMRAGLPLPRYEYYGDFEQIENGVGLIAEFNDNLDYSLSQTDKMNLGKRVGYITGESFAPVLRRTLETIDAHLGTSSTVFGIINNYFGNTVTVAGLVTAVDIMAQTDGAAADIFVLPDNMLREFTDMFLDNISIGEVEKTLGKPIVVVSHSGADLVEKLIENLG